MEKTKFIETYAELKALPNSTKVTCIQHGIEEECIVVGTVKQLEGVVLFKPGAEEELTFEREYTFKDAVWVLNPSPEVVGKILIDQVQQQAAEDLQNIRKLYLKEKATP